MTAEPHLHHNSGVVSRTFGRWHALGPYLYVERGNFLLHFYARWFRLDYQRGWHWGFTLWLGERCRLHRGGGR